MTEITQTRLIVGAVALAFILLWAVSRLIERRRRRWVERLATAFATTAVHGSDSTSHFTVNVGGRRCDLAQGYRSRTMNGRFIRGAGLIITVPLRNVPEIYHLTFNRRGGGRTSDALIVHDSGYHPRDPWLTESLREAMFDFYDVARDRAPLIVEGGALMYVTNRRVDSETLRALMERQIAVAARLESVL